MTRILVADDAPIVRHIAREILEPEGFEVVAEARDGAEAVDRFAALQPDLVLLDLVMPRVSGIDALRRIRLLDPAARVVMASALGQEPLAAEALWWGARDYVVKPFQPEALVATLRRARVKQQRVA